MGLEVFHYMLTHTPNNSGNHFFVGEWELDCNVALDHYSGFITDIGDYNFDKIIAIVQNDEDHEKLKKTEWFIEMEFMKVFIGDIDDNMQKTLAEYIVREKLDKLQISELGAVHDGIKYHMISFGEHVMRKGVYYEEVGYLPYGMSGRFYRRFRKYYLWGKQEDFDLAYACIEDDGYPEDYPEKINYHKVNFKENFLDKFVFGQSLLVASF